MKTINSVNTRMHSSGIRTVRCSGRLGGGCTPLPLWTEFLTHACENITFPPDGKNETTYSFSLLVISIMRDKFV